MLIMNTLQENEFVMYKGEMVRITCIKGDQAHISNMNMPFCGCICEWVPIKDLTNVRSATSII